jgi:hypothetical protein
VPAKAGNTHRKVRQTETHNLWFDYILPEIGPFHARLWSGPKETAFSPSR